MRVTIKSKKLNTSLTFSRPGGGYIYVDLNGKPGTLGQQACEGGSTAGSTLAYYGDDPERFATICRRWYRAYVRALML
jgi:hypothetical protein